MVSKRKLLFTIYWVSVKALVLSLARWHQVRAAHFSRGTNTHGVSLAPDGGAGSACTQSRER